MKSIVAIMPFCFLFLSCYAPEYDHIIERATPSAELKERAGALLKNEDFFRAFIARANLMSNAQRRQIAQKYYLQKISRWNYVFKTPLVPGYILKLGPIHWTNSFGGFAVRAKEVTNKNVSRVAYQQLVEDVIIKRKLKKRVVKKHLLEIPKDDGVVNTYRELNDMNYIVAVKDMEAILLSPKENLKRYRYITEDELEELRIIAREAYIADLKMPNCVFGTDNLMYLIDTEQTNKAHETDFFLKNPEQMEADTQYGLKWIERLVKARDDDQYYQSMLNVLQTAGPYYEMGIEPDDKPTVTNEFITLTKELGESF